MSLCALCASWAKGERKWLMTACERPTRQSVSSATVSPGRTGDAKLNVPAWLSASGPRTMPQRALSSPHRVEAGRSGAGHYSPRPAAFGRGGGVGVATRARDRILVKPGPGTWSLGVLRVLEDAHLIPPSSWLSCGSFDRAAESRRALRTEASRSRQARRGGPQSGSGADRELVEGAQPSGAPHHLDPFGSLRATTDSIDTKDKVTT